MKVKIKNRTQGFSLLEMMIAFIILSIAITSIYASLTNTLNNSSKRFKQYEATEFAVSLIAQHQVLRADFGGDLSGEYADMWRWDASFEQVQPSNHPSLHGKTFTLLKANIYSVQSNKLLASQQLILPYEALP